jgi:hypothetical protein
LHALRKRIVNGAARFQAKTRELKRKIGKAASVSL